jgi:hypothetical protein
MNIYLAGRIRGVKNYEAIFADAAQKLRMQGHQVFNPAASNQEGRQLNFIMAYLIPQLCMCGAIAMLPSWWRSGGARIEWMLAKYLKLKIIYLR